MKDKLLKDDMKDKLLKDDMKDKLLKDDMKDKLLKDDMKDKLLKKDMKDKLLKDDMKDKLLKDDMKDKLIMSEAPQEKRVVWSRCRQRLPTAMATNEGVGERAGDKGEAERGLDEDNTAPDGGWGWMITYASFLIMFLATIPTSNFGVLFSKLLMDQGTSFTMSSWIFSIALINANFSSFLIVPLVEEFGWRKVAFVSGLLREVPYLQLAALECETDTFLSSTNKLVARSQCMVLSDHQLVKNVGVMHRHVLEIGPPQNDIFIIFPGCCIRLMLSITYLVVPLYFDRRVKVAYAIMTSGSCLSQMVMPPTITYLQEEYGFRGATLIIGALLLNCCVAAMLLHPIHWHTGTSYKAIPEDFSVKEPKPSSTIGKANYNSISNIISITENKDLANIKLLTDVSVETSKRSVSGNENCLKEENGTKHNTLRRIFISAVNTIQFLRSPSVCIVCFMIGINLVIISTVYNFVPFSMREDGFKDHDSSMCLSVAGVCDIATRVICAFFTCCPRVRVITVFRFGSIVATVGIAGFSATTSLMGKAVTLGLCGVGNGFTASLYSLIIKEELGMIMLLPTLGNAGITSGVMFLIFPTLAGVLNDSTDSYMYSFLLCALGPLIAIVLSYIKTSALAYEKRCQETLPDKTPQENSPLTEQQKAQLHLTQNQHSSLIISPHSELLK
ncbi:hypothetical protein Pcinc_036805 [Petrolisthes cinctipes]|uniref:Uncharacterized protein n=1 Tax=Petrolisthes cinctipes TaxID=88211 RepID=A0AAE1BX86_PETCI|nr:hypothetical protein Pcinc_036805 [Petrolisthes cinctipes]